MMAHNTDIAPPSLIQQPLEKCHIVARLQKDLARGTNTDVAAVKLVTEYHGKAVFESAQRAHLKCPGDGDWLGTALACNAAQNKEARRLIENHARILWNAWITTLGQQSNNPTP